MTLAAASPVAHAAVRTVAIHAGDRAQRDRLARLIGVDASLAIVGIAGDLAALARLIETARVDVAVVDGLLAAQIAELSRRFAATAVVAIVDVCDAASVLDALRGGARAMLPGLATDSEIAIAARAAAQGLVVLTPDLLDAYLATPHGDAAARLAGATTGAADAQLTAREREVLAAMADGASNKTIARRLGISFHTAKFHVAGILTKLDADSRTEAVTKAAQLGLVML